MGVLTEFGTTTHFILPRPPYRVLPAPLVLTSHQPRVQRVKARLCEQGMWGRHEGNPQRGRGGQARGSQSCPGGPRAFDQRWPPCQLLGRLQAWGCVCCDRPASELELQGGLLGCGGTSKDMAGGAGQPQPLPEPRSDRQ